ncbi:MAG: hypothetical protein K6G04_08290 [Lachnospiraceae bacterium]|nr:hypothetical protein [Lachnospiraceae bacterium]
MNLSAIGSSSNSKASQYYKQLSSGKKINSAADDAAGLAIAEKQKAAVTQAKVSTQNYQRYQDKANVADSAMSGMTDYLQDMNANSIRAMNGLMSESDLAAIQQVNDQFAEGISQLGDTTYNEMPAIEGDAISSATPQNFDLSSIDSALASLNTSRSQVGAESNGYAYAAAVTANTAENLTASVSRLEDADMAEAVSGLKKEQTLEDFRVQMQKKEQDDQANQNRLFYQ